jgi:alpha-amylase
MPTAPLRHRRAHALLWFALGLAACGGGGSEAGPPASGGGGGGGGLPPVDVSTVALADPGSALPADWQRGAFMQVFVRSYQDSDGDGIGDLRGLTSRLDYLRDLGVRGLWLMPVGPSQDRDHGYAVTDYRDVEPQYGSLADFDELLREAHARGIGVVIDYVINHSAAAHPLFQNSRAAASNPYRDWYLWQPLKPTGWNIYGSDPWRANPAGGWYFAAFWDQMPDFNLRHPAVVAWHHDNLRFWLNRGVDGFRLDAVGHLVENGPTAWTDQPETLPLLRDARAVLDGYQRRFLVCEGPNAPVPYANACGSGFAFGHHARILEAARGSASALRQVADYFRSAPAGMATLLANHDSFAGQRLWDQLGGDVAAYKLAAATTLLMPGTPFVYYGEEIGMAGAAGLAGDPKLRTPMSWTGERPGAGFTTGTPYRALSANAATHHVQAQLADPDSLLSHYRAMLALRNGLAPLSTGSYEAVRVDGLLMSFQRRLAGERVVVAINYGRGAADAVLADLAPEAALQSRHPEGSADLTTDAGGSAVVTLAPQSLRVFVQR